MKMNGKLKTIWNNRKTYIRRYLWPLPKFHREIVVMVDGPGHGGLTDRMRNILSVYDFCKSNNMPFRIFYSYPCDLRLILQPNEYNWSIDKSEISFSKYDSKEEFLWVDVMLSKTGRKDIINQCHIKILNDIVTNNSKTQFHIHGNCFLSEGHYKSLFNELFKPSHIFSERLLMVTSTLPNYYEAVVFRFQNLFGDFNEYDFPVLLANQQQELIRKCRDKISELYYGGYFSTQEILITSDSIIFLQAISHLPFVRVITGKMEHIDCAKKGETESSFKSFLDLFLLMKAQKVTQLLTGQMYRSNFPSFAAELGGNPYNCIEF